MSTDTTHFYYNHPTDHKLAAFQFLLNRMQKLLLTPPRKQKEWNTILHTAKTKRFPYALLTQLNTRILHRVS